MDTVRPDIELTMGSQRHQHFGASRNYQFSLITVPWRLLWPSYRRTYLCPLDYSKMAPSGLWTSAVLELLSGYVALSPSASREIVDSRSARYEDVPRHLQAL